MSKPAKDDDPAKALLQLSEVVSLTHFRLNALVEALYGGAGAPSRRAVLRNVIVNGPMTVPQIAALRPVSRQYIQTVVDGLRAEGLVELAENPSHRRSKLVRPTGAGERLIASMEAREAPLFAAALEAVEGSTEGALAAAELLRKLNAHMDRLIEAARRGGAPS